MTRMAPAYGSISSSRSIAFDTFWRTLLTFSITRIVIAVVLMVYLTFGFKDNPLLSDELDVWRTCGAYLALAGLFVVLARRYQRRFYWQLVIQLLIDLLVMAVLYTTAGGTRSGLSILFLFPLAGGAILAPLTLALFFASLATMFLLLEAAYRILTFSADGGFSQAGLYGAAFLAAVYVINRLAAKLIRQESLAHRRGIDLQVQEAINRLVIADMGDGILVVGPGGEIYTGNPAAERMLGLSIPYQEPLRRLTDVNTLMPIADAFFAWLVRAPGLPGVTEDDGKMVVIKPGDELFFSAQGRAGRRELVTHLKLRFAVAQTAGLAEDRTVIFLQDVTEIENQAQQLKLASMGRLTASIAHEVRNPLSAISYAAALLNEEAPNPAQTRLLKIVGDNVSRLDRMIEDILKLSRKAHAAHEALALGPFFAETMEDFRTIHGLGKDRIQVSEMAAYQVRFDPLHLREVIVNLLANALRYASETPGSIRIFALGGMNDRLELHVQDDGPPLTHEVRSHLFEPFYTTSNKGTGLGLYLARELCLNNGGMIDYEYRSEWADARAGEISGRFVITLAAATEVIPAAVPAFVPPNNQ
jgi:two-component system sensor histidine kinase PilS (NtrC family)